MGYPPPPQQPPAWPQAQPAYAPQYGYGGWAFPHPPPPDPPELPEGASPWPKWPVWAGFAAMGIGLVATLVGVAIMFAIFSAAGGDSDSPGFAQVATVVQDMIFVGTAVFLAAQTMRPRPWQFGLRRTRFWPTVGWAAAGLGAFWVFVILFSLLVSPDGEQDTLDTLGTEDSKLLLVGAAILVVTIAPFAEEVFFRGFFYRSLRTKFGIAAAAAIDGLIFGVIHFQGADTLEIIPILAALGVIFCLVYERTGSLFAPIALHSLNNFLAFGSGTEEWAVAGIVGGTTIAICMLLPRLLPARQPMAGN
jgi:membrane protease YdiL (CAAX protease family)